MKVREHINFERGIDPKASMKIGIPTWETLQEDDLVICPQSVPLNNDNLISHFSPVSDLPKGAVLEVQELEDLSTKEWVLWYRYFGSMEDFQENRNEHIKERLGFIKGTPTQFKKLFKFLPRGMNESQNFERGIDPKQSMDIGMFHFDVEFSGDIENMEDDERMAARRWNYKGVRIIHIEGEANEDSSELFINLSDGDYIQFKQKSYNGPSRPERQDYGKISVKNSNIKDLEVHDAWLDELSNGSVILATMKMYEDIKDGKIIKESVNFERGKGPKSTMGIGRKNMIENWLKDQELDEVCTVNEDLTINSSDLVKIKDLEDGKLPEFIQFNIIKGGFNIESKGLTTLRGCPKKVLESESYKGNFKCGMNKLTSLEHSPKLVEGNYLCNSNPGLFIRSDVTKVCKVKSGKIWADMPTGYIMPVKEGMGFQRGGELPLDTLNIGHHSKVLHWFETAIHNPMTVFDEGEDFRINKDGTIDLLGDFSMNERGLESLPPFIRFNIAYGSFYAANNKFTSLDGFPKEIRGDFSIYGTSKKWKENEIRKRIKITGTVWN